MNNTNKVVLINKAFAISETGRVGFGFNCEDNVLTREEWEQKGLDAFDEENLVFDIPVCAECVISESAAAELHEFGELHKRYQDSADDETRSRLDEEIFVFWDDKENSGVFYDIFHTKWLSGSSLDIIMQIMPGDKYWREIER